MSRKNVLIYPSGADNALEVYRSIRHSVHLNVIPASGKADHSEIVYGQPVEYLPYYQEEGFVEALNELVQRRNIDLLFTTYDSVGLFLSSVRDRLLCKLILSDHATMLICRHKRLMYRVLKDIEACPEVFEEPSDGIAYPIFAKPDVGEGSRGTHFVADRERHDELKKLDPELVFVEYLPGKEYTIDCFTDRKGELLFVGPRERVETRMGMSFRARAVKEREAFEKIAVQINDRIRFRGLWFFQLKEDANGDLKLLEVAARAASTMGYFRHKGVNLPLLSVFDAMDMDVQVHESAHDVELFRSTENRYKYSFNYEKVYLDLDDTLIMNGKVNTDVIAFVHQCVDGGKQVHLITKHEFDIAATLRKHRISMDLFASVIHVPLSDRKVDHIDPHGAIFIDNWHKERSEVRDRFGIPVFDVDAVPSLILG